MRVVRASRDPDIRARRRRLRAAGAALAALLASGSCAERPAGRPSSGSPGHDPAGAARPHLDSSAQRIDLEAALLDLSRVVRRDLVGEALPPTSYARRMDELVEACREGLRRGAAGAEAVELLARAVFDGYGIVPVPDDDDVRRLFPDMLLEEKAGSCVPVSGLLLVLARRLELPLFAVLAPGHMFVRYDDGQVRRNVETLRRGLRRDDEFYRRRFGVPAGSGLYLRNLSDRELIAVFLYNAANAYRDAGRAGEARAAYELAASVLPGMAECRGNLGVSLLEAGEVEGAIREFRAAAGANPALEGIHFNLGAAYLHAGRRAEAIEAYRSGLAIHPDDPRLKAALETALTAAGPTPDDR